MNRIGKHFNQQPGPQPNEPRRQVATQAGDAAHGFDDPVVQLEHMREIARIWHSWVPVLDPELPKDAAAHFWQLYMAGHDSPPVRITRHLAAMIFFRHVEMN